MLTRRRFLKASAATTAAGLGIGFYAWRVEPHWLQLVTRALPIRGLPVRNRRYTAGEFALTGGRRLYISRGVGHLTQVRFNVRPEVTVFELQPG